MRKLPSRKGLWGHRFRTSSRTVPTFGGLGECGAPTIVLENRARDALGESWPFRIVPTVSPDPDINKFSFGIPHHIAKGVRNEQQTTNTKHQTPNSGMGVSYVRRVGVGVQIGQPGEGGLPM